MPTSRPMSRISILAVLVLVATAFSIVTPPTSTAATSTAATSTTATSSASADDPVAGETVTWGESKQVVNQAPFSTRTKVTGISCPTAGFCAAVNDHGAVRTAAGPGGPWTLRFADRSMRFTDVSCATASFCVAVSSTGVAYGSDDPTTAASWKIVLAQTYALNAVSCPATNLCLAAGRGQLGGGVFYSDDPLGGSWQPRITNETGEKRPVLDVGCAVAATVRCATVNVGGEQIGLTATDPSSPFGEGSQWSGSCCAGNTVACPSPAKCFTRYADSASELDCPSTSLCIEIDADVARRTTDPGNVMPVYTQTTTYAGEMTAVGCVRGGTACAIGTADGRIISTDDATAASATWVTSGVLEQLNSLTDVNCVSATACVAVDGTGHLLSSTTPTEGIASWTTTQVNPSGQAAQEVDCPTVDLCVAGYTNGEVVTTQDPFGTRTATVRNLAGAETVAAVSCPSSDLCVLATSAGEIITSTAPTTAAWTTTPVSASGIRALTCPTSTQCYAVTLDGAVYTSSNPTGGASAWKYRGAAQGVEWAPYAISCSSSGRRCVVGDSGGHLWRFDPSEVTAWYEVPVAGTRQDTVVSQIIDADCSADGVCVAVSATGYRITLAPDPDENWAYGTAQVSAAGLATYQGVACAGTSFCLTADVAGEMTTGTINHATLAIVRTGPGTGTVTSLPVAIDCGATCTLQAPVGSTYNLTAAADPGSIFYTYGGAPECGPYTECLVVVGGDLTVTVDFGRYVTLTAAPDGPGRVKVSHPVQGGGPYEDFCASSCSSTFESGTVVTLTALPNPNATFTGWTGDVCTGSANPCVLTMSDTTSVVAGFTAPPVEPTAPVITKFGVSPKSVVSGKSVTFAVTSSGAGVARLVVGKPTPGRLVGGVCKPETPKNKKFKKCTYDKTVKVLSKQQPAGKTSIAFSTKKLAAGIYKATVTVTGPTGLVSRPKVLTFKIKKR